MNAARLKSDLDALITMAKTLRQQIDEDESALTPAPIFMSVVDYAEHAQVSEKTVRRWIRLGLPVRRQGKIIRIRVAEADAWSEQEATLLHAANDAQDPR